MVIHGYFFKGSGADLIQTPHLFQWFISRKVEEPLSVWRFREDLWWVITEADEHVLSKPQHLPTLEEIAGVGMDLNLVRSEWTFKQGQFIVEP